MLIKLLQKKQANSNFKKFLQKLKISRNMGGLTIRVVLMACLVYSAASHHLKVKREAASSDPVTGLTDTVGQAEGSVGQIGSSLPGTVSGVEEGLGGSVGNVESGAEGTTSDLNDIKSTLLSQVKDAQEKLTALQASLAGQAQGDVAQVQSEIQALLLKLKSLESSLTQQVQGDVNNLPQV